MMEKYKEEYSVIKPATSSDSASARSNGTLFDSPSIHMISTTVRTTNIE
jgi:hypothetical protein